MTTAVASSRTRAQRDLQIILIAYAGFVVFGLADGALGVAWPSMRATFGVPLSALGLLLFASSCAFLVTSFNSGPIATRMGMGVMLLTASALRMVGLFGFALAPDWRWMVTAAVVYGGGSGLLDSGMNTHFATRFSARLMNWLHASFGLGATIGPLIMTAVLSNSLAWRWGYVVVAGSQTLVTVLILMTLGSWRDDEAGDAASGSDASAPVTRHASMLETLHMPYVWANVLLFLLYAGTEVTAGQWAFSLFTESRGVDIATAGFWVSVYWGTFTVGRLFYGFIADRVDSVQAVRFSMVIAVLAALLLWWNGTNLVGFLGLAAMGFATAPIFPLLTSTTPQRVGPRHTANVIGYQVGAANLGIAVLPGLAGVLAARMGLEIIGPFLVAASVAMLVLYEVILRMEGVKAP